MKIHKNNRMQPKRVLVVILGPTASGKSELAVKIARQLNGEIVSADSRQVYKGMDIGSGKITAKEMKHIPHHLLDIFNPKRKFTVAHYRKLALKAINKIYSKGKTPILCGGAGFYIQSVVDGILIPEVKPDWKLRKKLEKMTTGKLFALLKKLDSKRAKNIDRQNRRRLIRALEIIYKTRRPVPALKAEPFLYPVLILGIKKNKKELNTLIEKRFSKWLKKGFLKEVKRLKKSGLSWNKIEEFGMHYRQAAKYLRGKISYNQMTEESIKQIRNYSKRQMVWFQRDRRIYWVKNYQEAEKIIQIFLKTV